MINPCQLSSSFLQSVVAETAVHHLKDSLYIYELTDLESLSSLTRICGPIATDDGFTEVVDTDNSGIIMKGSRVVTDASITVTTLATKGLTRSNN